LEDLGVDGAILQTKFVKWFLLVQYKIQRQVFLMKTYRVP